MFKQKRLTVLSMAVLLALLVASVMPFAVLADDSAPPPPDAPVVEKPAAEEPSAEVPVVDGPVANEPVAEEPAVEAPVAEEPVADIPVVEVPVAEEPSAEVPVVDVSPTEVPVLDETLTVPEILEAAPEGTELVVLDADGESLPLVSEAALTNVFTGDPMWCPAGVLPGGDGCTKSFTKFNGEGGLIDALETQKATYFSAGTIYVESTYNATTAGDTTDNISFISSFMGLTDLVFQGGWDFASNSVVGTSTFDLGADKQLAFLWDAGNLTLKDINITNSSGLEILSSIGALTVAPATTTDVALDNVSVTNSGFTMILATGDVTVTDSDFNNNKEGLIAFTEKGDVTVTNSVFNNNAGGLASGSGLLVMTGEGDITLENVTATGNGFGGEDTLLQSSSSDPFDFYGSGIVLMTGEMSATELTASMTGGNITLNNVIASGNFGNGVVIASGGDVSVTCGTFENNGGYGVLASLPGILTNDSNTFNGNASGDIYMEGGTRVDKSSGCGGGEESRRKNKDLGPFVPQVIAVATPLTLDELPGTLLEGKTFVAGMSVKLMLGDEEIDEWPAGVQTSFDIPTGMEPATSLTVLFWNGTEWVEVPSAIVDGKVVFSITEPGIYVLVSP